MRKCSCMKFLCILSGCPAGARKWHISCFAMLLHSKKPGWPLPYAGSAIRDAFCKKRNNPWLFLSPQSGVISVNSYYLTSLVTSHFYGFRYLFPFFQFHFLFVTWPISGLFLNVGSLESVSLCVYKISQFYPVCKPQYCTNSTISICINRRFSPLPIDRYRPDLLY